MYTCWRSYIRNVINWGMIFIVFIISGLLGAILEGTDFLGLGFLVGSHYHNFDIGGWLIFTLFFLFLGFIVITTMGRVLKGDSYAYFYIETDLFDADDISAMNMTVHKTLIRTLDNSGIDISNFRLKRDFKGGRRDENF